MLMTPFMKNVMPYEKLGKTKVDRTKEDVVAFITTVASQPKKIEGVGS